MSKRSIKRKRNKASRQSTSSTRPKNPGRLDVSLDELKQILEKTKSVLNEDEVEKLGGAVDTLAVVTKELELKGASIRRLRKMLFGSSSEKMRDIFPEGKDRERQGSHNNEQNSQDELKSTNADEAKEPDVNSSSKEVGDGSSDTKRSEKKSRKGHGRNGADKYTGANKEKHDHESLTHKGDCPEEGCTGKLYRQKEPKRLVRVTGVAPLSATIHELERLRCNLCGKIFTANGPENMGDETYDNRARAMIVVLKYGTGTPLYRLERLQKNLGVPLPSSTQWDEIVKLGDVAVLVYTELIAQAANGRLLHNDDTTAKILNLVSQPLIGKNGKERTGLFTSGILSVGEGREIALFFTGREHAGNNLEKVLSQRNAELSAPIHMCDGMTVNTTGDFETILANCNVHARRGFIEAANNFPAETERVLNAFKSVYKNDDDTKGMSDKERLAYHLQHSKPVLDDLEKWFHEIMDDEDKRYVEPNNTLGGAIQYMRDHWDKLTLFLRVPGAPLDNNACERILKKAILHRKNALFFRTENGARTADIFMSIIHTCELANVNPFEYLVAIADNAKAVSNNPAAWLPWNYHLNK